MVHFCTLAALIKNFPFQVKASVMKPPVIMVVPAMMRGIPSNAGAHQAGRAPLVISVSNVYSFIKLEHKIIKEIS